MKMISAILFFALSVSIGLTSCKKYYSCRCVTTISSQSKNISYSTNKNKIAEKLTIEQAKAVCSHEAENINQTYVNYETVNGNYAARYGFKTGCSVE